MVVVKVVVEEVDCCEKSSEWKMVELPNVGLGRLSLVPILDACEPQASKAQALPQ